MAFMYQVSTLQALAKGDFYGNATIEELLWLPAFVLPVRM